MAIDKYISFNLMSEIKIEETIGNYIIRITPRSFCPFTKDIPTNHLHNHDHYELCFVLAGKGEYIHGDAIFPLTDGNIFIANPGVNHEIRLIKDIDGLYSDNLYLVFFDVDILSIHSTNKTLNMTSEYSKFQSFLSNHDIVSEKSPHILGYLEFIDIYTHNKSKDIFGIYNILKIMVYDMLFLLINTDNNSLSNTFYSNNVLNEALLYIESNLNKELCIKDISNHVFTSDRNLHYLFKKHMNRTVKNYINYRKMNLASVYLKMNYTVTDVCTLVGMSDLSQFSRLFKSHFGISPKKYQLQK